MESNPLTYERQTLIDALKERLAETQAKRDEQAAAAAERNKKVRDQIVALMDEFPQFLVNVTSNLTATQDAVPGTEAFAERIKGRYSTTPAGGNILDRHDPDAAVKRLIRVYEKAVDERVKVYVDDEVYDYL